MFYLCAHICMYYVYIRGLQSQKRGPLELELQMVVSIWVMRRELGSSRRAASALKPWAIFPASANTYFHNSLAERTVALLNLF